MRSLLPVLAATALASLASAQCATLTVTGSGAPGTDLTIDLAATPRSFSALLIGQTAGTTTLNAGPISLTIDLLMPFAPLPLGLTDNGGNASVTLHLPANIPAADLLGQGLAVSFGTPPNFGLSFCTSNVVSFHVGS